MITEQMKKLWEGLSGGMEDIYKRYSEARRESDRQYQSQMNQAEDAYRKEQNAVSAAAKIRDLNTQNALAAQGLGRSGESFQAQLMNGLSRASALSDAAGRYDANVNELNAAKRKEDLASEKEMVGQMRDLSKDLYNLKLQENKLEQEAEEAQRAEERAARELDFKISQAQKQNEQADRASALDERKMDLQEKQFQFNKEKSNRDYDAALKKLIEDYEDQIAALEDSISIYEGKEAADTKYKLDLTPAQMFDKILSDNSVYNDVWSGDGKYRAKVADAVNLILGDAGIDESYKKALETYARVGGFI